VIPAGANASQQDVVNAVSALNLNLNHVGPASIEKVAGLFISKLGVVQSSKRLWLHF